MLQIRQSGNLVHMTLFTLTHFAPRDYNQFILWAVPNNVTSGPKEHILRSQKWIMRLYLESTDFILEHESNEVQGSRY